jgi:hypothetical protein
MTSQFEHLELPKTNIELTRRKKHRVVLGLEEVIALVTVSNFLLKLRLLLNDLDKKSLLFTSTPN